MSANEFININTPSIILLDPIDLSVPKLVPAGQITLCKQFESIISKPNPLESGGITTRMKTGKSGRSKIAVAYKEPRPSKGVEETKRDVRES